MDIKVGDVVKCIDNKDAKHLVLGMTYKVVGVDGFALSLDPGDGSLCLYLRSRFERVSDTSQNDTPSHYDLPMSPLDFIMANKLPFAEGCIIKYVSRYKRKGGKEDLLKARVYLDRLIKEYDDERR